VKKNCIAEKSRLKARLVLWSQLLLKVFFFLEMHQNYRYFFFKFIFDFSTSKGTTNTNKLI
jgi:hypothetical protein